MGVSVVIPTKDRLAWLRRVLPSYLDQPETEQVIVVIDGATDGTREFLADLRNTEPRVEVIDCEVNRGIPIAKNLGIEAARAAFTFIGEDDVELTPGFFATLLAHLEAAGADLVAGRTVWRRETESAKESLERTARLSGPAIDLRWLRIDGSVLLPDDAEQIMLPNPVLGSSAVFREIRFDPGYRGTFWREETDFQFSAVEAGYRLLACPHALCFNYVIRNDRGGVHAASLLRRVYWIGRNNWYFTRKHADLIRDKADVGSIWSYPVRLVVRVVWEEEIVPPLVWARRVVSAQRRRLTAVRRAAQFRSATEETAGGRDLGREKGPRRV